MAVRQCNSRVALEMCATGKLQDLIILNNQDPALLAMNISRHFRHRNLKPAGLVDSYCCL
jgi:hypothetical protein